MTANPSFETMIRQIEEEGCVQCGVCDFACPADVIRMDSETGKAYIAHRESCWTCFACERACPTGVVEVHPYRSGRPDSW